MTKIILSGSSGKMGRVIADTAAETENVEIVAGLDIYPLDCGFKVYKNPMDCTEEADVIIDFSNPAAFDSLIDFALERRIPLVMATTGLSTLQLYRLQELAKEIPVFHSANMSVGVNLLIDLVKKAAAFLGEDFNIEIIEKHHNQKVDAPSGTALMIADAINDNGDNLMEYVFDRHSVRKKRTNKEIGIHAVRGGTIVGEHTVLFAGDDEIVEINHRADSKRIFAKGALKSAVYLSKKENGLYSMEDMLSES